MPASYGMSLDHRRKWSFLDLSSFSWYRTGGLIWSGLNLSKDWDSFFIRQIAETHRNLRRILAVLSAVSDSLPCFRCFANRLQHAYTPARSLGPRLALCSPCLLPPLLPLVFLSFRGRRRNCRLEPRERRFFSLRIHRNFSGVGGSFCSHGIIRSCPNLVCRPCRFEYSSLMINFGVFMSGPSEKRAQI